MRPLNEAKNAADAREIRVLELEFDGASEVFADISPRAVAQYLRIHGGYKGPFMMDAGLYVRLPDGTEMCQGQSVLDRWIEEHS